MPHRLHDKEFSAPVLRMLKDREILSESNPVHSAILIYNIGVAVEDIKLRYDNDRKQNPLLETTPAEAWLTKTFVPIVRSIRFNVDVSDPILVAALSRYFRRAAPPVNRDSLTEQQLCTSIHVYRPALTRLLRDLYDRRRSLNGILGIRAVVRSPGEALSERKPSTMREAIILSGIKVHWTTMRLAKELDKTRCKPRSYKSYVDMVQANPQHFYALKSQVKKKYSFG